MPCYMKFMKTLFVTVFFLSESFSVGPQVPSVAVYSTKDKQSECPPTSCVTMFNNYTALFPTVLIDLQICNKQTLFNLLPCRGV